MHRVTCTFIYASFCHMLFFKVERYLVGQWIAYDIVNCV